MMRASSWMSAPLDEGGETNGSACAPTRRSGPSRSRFPVFLRRGAWDTCGGASESGPPPARASAATHRKAVFLGGDQLEDSTRRLVGAPAPAPPYEENPAGVARRDEARADLG